MTFEAYETSSAQKRIYLVHQLHGKNILYNIPNAFIIEGNVTVPRLEWAFNKLVRRHESLRTCFVVKDREILQKVYRQVNVRFEYRKTLQMSIDETIDAFIKPFDLDCVPLWRVGLVHLDNNRRLFLFDIHHSIADGLSISIIINELMDFYQGMTLPPLQSQYVDFTLWQNDLFQSEEIKQQEKYWLDLFQGELPELNMPIEHSRSSTTDSLAHHVYREIEPGIGLKIREFALSCNITLNLFFWAVYFILLWKYTGQQDIVVGTPAAGRSHPELEKMVGMFVNTLALRTYIDPQITVNEFLENFSVYAAAAFENQDFPFEMLVEKLQVERQVGRDPLFDTMFTFEITDSDSDSMEIVNAGLKLIPIAIEEKTAKFDLTFSVSMRPRGVVLDCEYAAALFQKGTIKRLVRHYNNILEQITHHPWQPLHQLDMLSTRERYRLLVEFNETEAEYPRDKTIPQLFAEQVEKTPDHIASLFEEHQLSYKTLNARVNRLAALLREKGVKPGIIIAVMVKRSLEMLMGIMAALKAGGTYLPIDPQFPPERIKYVLEDSTAGILLTQKNVLHDMGGKLPTREIVYINEKLPGEYEVAENEIGNTSSSTDLAYVIYTSGSTGRPKGILVEHYSVVNLVCSQRKRFLINDSDRILQFSPYYFDASVEQIFIALSSGAALVLISKETILDHERFEKYISMQLITHIHAVPSFLNNMKIKPFSSLKRVISGGDICPVALAKKWSQVCDFYNEYGPTETTVTSIEMQVKQVDETLSVLPIGKPISNTIVYVLDKSVRPVPLNIAGELVIGGEGVSRGYLNNPELTAEKFDHDLWDLQDYHDERKKVPDRGYYRSYRSNKSYILYKTGDLARWLPDGNIECLGRIDSQIKLRGFRIELGEIESRLLEHDEIKEVVVTAKAGDRGDKYLCAYIVLNTRKELDPSELKEFLSVKLPDYMIPACFVTIEKFPLTPNGKIDWKALPGPGIHMGTEGYAPPQNKIQETLVNIWSDVLNLEKNKISINSNFFQLGGHSLKAASVISRIYNELDIRVPLIEIFKTPTVRQLAQYIKWERKTGSITDKNLVLLKKSTDDAEHLFFIHDATGDVEGYIEFCKGLDINVHCWGIRAAPLENYTPVNLSIESIAANYIKILRKVQPHGPYCIAGWSLGGVIAFEMALQLETIGQNTAFLGLIDAPAPQMDSNEDLIPFSLQTETNLLIQYIPGNEIKEIVKNISDKNEIWPFIVNYLEENGFSVEIIKQLIPHRLARAIPNYDQPGIRQLIYYMNINRTLTNAGERYIPSGRISTAVHYFKASQSPVKFREYWNDYCLKPINSHEIPGDHFSIFKTPRVDQTAKVFVEVLANIKSLKN